MITAILTRGNQSKAATVTTGLPEGCELSSARVVDQCVELHFREKGDSKDAVYFGEIKEQLVEVAEGGVDQLTS